MSEGGLLRLHVVPVPVGQRSTLVPTIVLVAEPEPERVERSVDYVDTVALLERIGASVVGNAPLPLALTHRGISLWHFVPAYTFPDLYRAVEVITTLAEVVARRRPSTIELEVTADRDGDIVAMAARAVAAANGAEMTVVRSGAPTRGRLREQVRRLADAATDVTGALVTLGSSPRAMAAQPRALLLSYPVLWMTEPLGGGRRYDAQFSRVATELLDRGWHVTAVDLPYRLGRRASIATLRDRIRSEPRVKWRVLPGWWRRFTCRLRGRTVEAAWRAVEQSGDVARAMHVSGVPSASVLLPLLRRAIVHDILDVTAMIDRVVTLLDLTRPDVVAMSYETGPMQRAAIVEARRRGIATVGLQHGAILENDYEHMLGPVTTDPVRELTAFPVPSVMCCWGDVYADAMTGAGPYPRDAVEVTGHWRFDPLWAHAAGADRARIRRELTGTSASRLAVVTSSEQETVDYLTRCLDVLARLDDIAVVVKPHPAEPLAAIRQLVDGRRDLSVTLIADGLLDAIAAADVVISQPSTVVTEAVALDRPVVLVDLFADPATASGWEPLVASGVCLRAGDQASLEHAITGAFDDHGVRAGLAAARPAFVTAFFGPRDGRAAARVADVMERLASGRNR